ncbi:MAG: hypothetical protein NG747_07150 [Candidatus Brocadia sp.]|nr:hypothetical protein [Candidatus Brocadia sp.]
MPAVDLCQLNPFLNREDTIGTEPPKLRLGKTQLQFRLAALPHDLKIASLSERRDRSNFSIRLDGYPSQEKLTRDVSPMPVKLVYELSQPDNGFDLPAEDPAPLLAERLRFPIPGLGIERLA